jgi:hypothetical protein
MAPSSQRSAAARFSPQPAVCFHADLAALNWFRVFTSPVGSRASLAAERHKCRPYSLRPDPRNILMPTLSQSLML